MTEKKLWVDQWWRDRLIEARLAKGYSCEYLAKKLGVSTATYSRYERGEVDHICEKYFPILSKELDIDLSPVPDNYDELVMRLHTLQKLNDDWRRIVILMREVLENQ